MIHTWKIKNGNGQIHPPKNLHVWGRLKKHIDGATTGLVIEGEKTVPPFNSLWSFKDSGMVEENFLILVPCSLSNFVLSCSECRECTYLFGGIKCSQMSENHYCFCIRQVILTLKTNWDYILKCRWINLKWKLECEFQLHLAKTGVFGCVYCFEALLRE